MLSNVNRRVITIPTMPLNLYRVSQSAKRHTTSKGYNVQRENDDEDSREQNVQSDEKVEEKERDRTNQRQGY